MEHSFSVDKINFLSVFLQNNLHENELRDFFAGRRGSTRVGKVGL